MYLCHPMVTKPQNVFVGAYRRHLFWMRFVKMIKFAAFSPLVLKSIIFEKIKYAQVKECLGFLRKRGLQFIFRDNATSVMLKGKHYYCL